MSRLLLFQIIFFSILFLLFIFEYIIYIRWKKRFQNKKTLYIFSLLFWCCVIFSNLGFLFFFLFRKNFYLEIEGIIKPIYYFLLSWNYAFFFSFFIWIVFFTLFYCLYWIIKKIKIIHNKTVKEASLSRKAFLSSSVGLVLDSTPFLGTGFNFSGMYLGSKEFTIFKKQIPISNLEPVFVGLRIVHISDIHIGALINESYLRPTIEIIRSLKPDLIVITGDILDNSQMYLNTVGWYLQKLREIAPVYSILGNHDHIEKPLLLIKTLNKADSITLINDFALFKRDKKFINIIGLDYPIRYYESKLSRSYLSEMYFKKVFNNLPDKDNATIVLNHHPSEFEYLKKYPISLVLSGHTHGGQIILSEDRHSPLSLASNFLKYYVDLYTENNVSLYVNRGLGHWFPLRINCPPEITLIELY